MSCSVLFICFGNICRSPAAEGLLKHRALSDRLKELTVDSAGVGWSGFSRLPSSLMREVALEKGITLDSYSRGVEVEDFFKFDYLIPMDRENYRTLLSLCPEKKLTRKIVPATSFIEDKTMEEVPDPYGGAKEEYEAVFSLIDQCVNGLVKEIKKSGYH